MEGEGYTLPQLSDAKETKEGAALREFKTRLKDFTPLQDDHFLLKWLKARNNDVTKAEIMFRASMAYREKLKVDSILTDYDPPEVLTKYVTGGTCGHDKQGSPVRVELYGRLDMKGLMYSARKIDLEKYKLRQCEKHAKDWEEMSKKLNRQVDGLTVIFDMEGVSRKMLWRPGLQMYLHLVKVLEDNYPEMLKRMFVINAPRIFPLLYKVCRPLISEDTKNKIHVLGSDYSKTLLEYIDAEELPTFLGGTKTDPDGNPRCVTMICQGGQVPEEYFLKDVECPENLETATVSRGDTLSLDYEVQKEGSVLRWEFKTDGYDIGFGVFRYEGKTKVPVLETERVNSHMVPEDGSLCCEIPGTYSLVFDNTYSMVRDKHVSYYIDVITNDENTLVFDNSFSWARGKHVRYNIEVIDPVDKELNNDIAKMLGEGVAWSDIAKGDNTDIFTTKL